MEIRYREIKDVDVVLLDESHRMYTKVINDAEKWVMKSKAISVFSYDPKQSLSATEFKKKYCCRY